jgi:hypothetical protein
VTNSFKYERKRGCVKQGDWTRDEILLTFKLYVEIRDDQRDDNAPIKDLAKLLDRTESAVRAAVFAPAKDDPLWRGRRPNMGLTPTARAFWDEHSKDLSRLRTEARNIERRLRLARQTP